tara:strand:+ start:757 stop:1053 length:297 start_codon:yes stop_codon:yes gene_type:complete
MTRVVVTDSADEVQLKKAADAQKERDLGLSDLMQSQRGRAWMHDFLFTRCHVHSGSHVPGCSDSTAFNEGARSIGASLLQEIADDHTAHYLKMLQENL